MPIVKSWKKRRHALRDAQRADQILSLFDIGDLHFGHRTRNQDRIRALASAIGLSQSQVLARVLGRYKMYVDPQDFGLSPHLLLDGYWEMPTTEAIAQCLRPGMIAADVGANLGYFTMLMADLVGPSGKVLAFEPNPLMVERISRSAYLNGFSDRIAVHGVALAAASGPVSFLMPSDEPKNAYISAFNGEVPVGAVVIEAERLDSRPEWHEIEFLKIDAEGAEEQIWKGASGLKQAQRLKTIILEFQQGRSADAPAFIAEILDWGFSLEWINPDAGIEPITVTNLLNRNPNEDIMLVFRREL